jgi:hypothetical protein
VVKEISIKKAEFRKFPELKLTFEQKEEVKRILDEQLRSSFPKAIDMRIVYDIADALKGIGIDNAEIMKRIANFRGNIETFTSPTIIRTPGRRLIDEDLRPEMESGLESFKGIQRKISEIISKTNKIPSGDGYVAILSEDGIPVNLIDFGKFVTIETKDALQTHIETKGWTPTANVLPFLVFSKMHETKKILEILRKAIDESK